MKEVEIEYPEIEIQTKIVKVLDKDSSYNECKKTRNRQFKHPYQITICGNVWGCSFANPMHWPVKKLKDLSVQINSGNTPKRWLGKLC